MHRLQSKKTVVTGQVFAWNWVSCITHALYCVFLGEKQGVLTIPFQNNWQVRLSELPVIYSAMNSLHMKTSIRYASSDSSKVSPEVIDAWRT